MFLGMSGTHIPIWTSGFWRCLGGSPSRSHACGVHITLVPWYVLHICMPVSECGHPMHLCWSTMAKYECVMGGGYPAAVLLVWGHGSSGKMALCSVEVSPQVGGSVPVPRYLLAAHYTVRLCCPSWECKPSWGQLLPPTASLPSQDPLSPSWEKEEPRRQRPSSQARQLGLKLPRGGSAPPPPWPSWSQAFPTCLARWPTPESLAEQRVEGAGALLGAGTGAGTGTRTEVRAGIWGSACPQQQCCFGHEACGLQSECIVLVEGGWECAEDLKGRGIHGPGDQAEQIRLGSEARAPLWSQPCPVPTWPALAGLAHPQWCHQAASSVGRTVPHSQT